MIRRWPVRILRSILKGAGRSLLGTITHVLTDEPVAALTFDDGPDQIYTPLLLKILEKYRVRATFFMVGEAAHNQQKLVHEVAQSGHAIGIHSWNHLPFLSINGRERRRQIRACETAIHPYRGRLFRPPWGEQSLMSRLDPILLGYQVVTWNVVAEDWLDIKPEEMAQKLMGTIKTGSIVLLHDAIYRSIFAVPQYDRRAMLMALDIFLKDMGDKFRFVTVPELLKYGRPHRENWYVRIPTGTEIH